MVVRGIVIGFDEGACAMQASMAKKYKTTAAKFGNAILRRSKTVSRRHDGNNDLPRWSKNLSLGTHLIAKESVHASIFTLGSQFVKIRPLGNNERRKRGADDTFIASLVVLLNSTCRPFDD
jgi:hypothetical protein